MSLALDYINKFPISESRSCLPNKLLVSAGPANFSPRVISALANHTTGVTCKEMYQMMEDVKTMLQYVFQTRNEITLALQTSGTGGIEAALCNILDPGEKVMIAVSGYWGERMIENAKIRKLHVVRLDTTAGEIFDLEELKKEVVEHKPVALVLTHGESSGGTVQNLEGVGRMCHTYNCLLVVDAIVTLGGVPFFTDRWEVDVVVSATQKAIGAPPGLALLTMSPKAVARMKNIKHPPPFYFNILDTCQMWSIFGGTRRYYITYSSHTMYALREALIEILEEGLVNRWERHKVCVEQFWAGLKEIKMDLVVQKPQNRLITVTCCTPPADVDTTHLINYLLDKHLIVVGFGISKLASNALRIGFMGYNARAELVEYVLRILCEGIEFCRKNPDSCNSKTHA